jgi:uncharacterized protein (TIGR03067 family)
MMLTALALIVALAPPGAAGSDQKALTGTWRIIDGELAGARLPEEMKQGKLIINGTKYIVRFPGEQEDRGRLEIVTSQTPRAVDVIGEEGRTRGRDSPRSTS